MEYANKINEHKEARQQIAQEFQDQIKEINSQLEGSRSKKNVEFDENRRLRESINGLIQEYREKEAAYNQKMQSNNTVFENIEKLQKDIINGTVSQTVKQLNDEKTKFDSVTNRVQELSQRINNFMEKFNALKTEMNENGTKFTQI